MHKFVKKLLDGREVRWEKLGDVVNTITAPSKIKRKDYKKIGKIPIIDQGIDFIAGYTDENLETIKKDDYILFGDHSEHIKFVNFEFIQGADGLKILKPKNSDNAKYIYYAFQNFYKKHHNYKRHWSFAKETIIPIPPLEIQKQIVEILDKFDNLINSISEGLPKEIELREKQYRYYRDLLLDFK